MAQEASPSRLHKRVRDAIVGFDWSDYGLDEVVGADAEYAEHLAQAVIESLSGGNQPGPVCQYCLADARYTPVATDHSLNKRCPVCGSAYNGPRRDALYRVLVESGLVARDD